MQTEAEQENSIIRKADKLISEIAPVFWIYSFISMCVFICMAMFGNCGDCRIEFDDTTGFYYSGTMFFIFAAMNFTLVIMACWAYILWQIVKFCWLCGKVAKKIWINAKKDADNGNS